MVSTPLGKNTKYKQFALRSFEPVVRNVRIFSQSFGEILLLIVWQKPYVFQQLIFIENFVFKSQQF